jgi:YVTN family beta-propeller protein
VAELPHGTITFLFTDIEGSTRLLKQLGERYGVARADHHRLLRAAFAQHDGQEIDTQGDAFFVAFRRAKDAVAAAADAQHALAAHEWPDGSELRVRMGMHTGEPSVSEDGYLGLGVHRAARICSAGHGGQVLLSQATVALLEDEELPGVELRDLGLHQLKDLDRPERIHQLVLDGLPDSFPPLKAPQSQPDAATPFEGREGELAEAAQAAVATPPWYRRRVSMLTIAALLVAGLVAGGLVLSAGGSNALARIDADSAGLIDAKSGDIKRQVAVGASPGAVTIGAGSVWVASGNGTISRIDPKANLVTQTFPLDNTPSGIAYGDGAVWFTTNEDRRLRRISPAANKIGGGIPVGNGPSDVAVGNGAVWVANRFDDTVTKVPTGEGDEKVFRAGLTPTGIAVGAGAIWISNEAAGTVSRLDPKSGALQAITVGNGPSGIAVGAGGVWVANSIDGTVSRINPADNSVAAATPVGKGPAGVAIAAGSVWVTNRYDGTVSRVDPSTAHVTDTIPVGESPGGIASEGSDLWVSARGRLTAHRGGTLKLLGGADEFDSIDPAAAYTLASWGTRIITNDGLLTFRRVAGSDGTQIVPDLATSVPHATDGGKTYTFQLRDGIRYSNGVPLKASDFRWALERFFKIHAVPPYFQSIVGAEACGRNPARCDLSRGVVADDAAGSVTFHLASPAAEFLYELALPFGQAVPRATPARIATRPIPATGPYMIARYVPKKRVELVRNPHFREWSRAAQPDGFPDRIAWSLGAQPDAQVTAIERGKADLSVSFLPTNRLPDLTAKYTEQLHVNSFSGTVSMFLNTRLAPFDHLAARRALNYAIDRDAVVRLGFGPQYLQPTCQILPPNFPGYRPYCPYTLHATKNGTWTAPDLARARRLVAASGTHGAKVTVWAFRDAFHSGFAARLARYFASVLKGLGYRASAKVLPTEAGPYFMQAADSRRRVQIGFTAWAPDYPAASNFLNLLFTCASFKPGDATQLNFTGFCNRSIDTKIRRALDLQADDPAAAGPLWAEIDRAVTDQAPWVPTHNSKWIGFVSKRVGNYQFNPEWGVLYDQLWVR